jgi:hypothetical protein
MFVKQFLWSANIFFFERLSLFGFTCHVSAKLSSLAEVALNPIDYDVVKRKSRAREIQSIFVL